MSMKSHARTMGVDKGAGSSWKRVLPVVVIFVVVVGALSLGLHRYLSFEQLRLHRGALMSHVATMPVMAVLLFIAIYALTTSLSLPGGSVLTLSGGFLFGMWQGSIAVVVGATLGATVLFLAARSVLADALRAKAGPWLARMEAGFKDDAASYMLVLRLIPGFPFFIVNLVPAFLGVPLRTFVATTFLGIIPGTFVYASIGAGLGSIFDQMEAFTLKDALTPQVLTALTGLAALSLVPVGYKRLKARRAA
jgi:uncharacterized membrane protein YdjX (TVP38/TMEM64 family)